MQTPQTPAATTPNASADGGPKPSEFEGDLSPDQAATMAGWAKEDLAANRITQTQADTIFADLGIPLAQRGLQPDTRSREQQQLDESFPAAKPADYIIQYDKSGQAPPMDPIQKQNLAKFDQTARGWLTGAGFTREHGNTLTMAIGRVVESTKGMNDSQLEAYGRAEFAKLQNAYPDLEAKLQLTRKLVAELDGNQPGLKQLLKTRGIGDSALVVSQLIQQAERWEIRHKR